MSPRSERGVEVDADPLRVLELRVALAPERVPRLLLAVEARLDDARVGLVDLGGASALEGERDLVAGLARPVGPEAPHRLLVVEHEADAVREERVDVAVVLAFRDVEPEEPVEAD